jgi:uncharacterized DUF497 family protein
MQKTRFNWDAGNARKNEKHGVSPAKVEQVFLNTPLLLAPDVKHSQDQSRLRALGKTDQDLWLYITFTERANGELIRPEFPPPDELKGKSSL